MYNDRNNEVEEIRFSSRYLIEEWAVKNGKPLTNERNRQSKRQQDEYRVLNSKPKTQKRKERSYKGMGGRIGKDGNGGWFDVDHKGRIICV